MPRKSVDHDDMPRRRGARAAAIEPEAEHGLAMRIFLYSPKDMIAGALAVAIVCAIIVNALFMQAGRHPAPMFGTVVTLPVAASLPANPLPRLRSLEGEIPLPEARPVEARAADPMANLVKTTSSVQPSTASIPRPPLAVPISTRSDGAPLSASHRIAAVQRALAENGYGQLKATGVIGADTQAAIQRFERARKLPVTGQVSDRLVRELALTIGHPIE